MSIRLYLSLTPEALIASMLSPADFGKYVAIGPKRQTSGPAIFLELDPAKVDDATRSAMERCQAHPDGQARRSTYLRVYRALESVPLSSMTALHLVTRAGFVLTLKPHDYVANDDERFFLYQELGPVYPRAISRLEPRQFAHFITDPANPLHIPKIAFCDLRLGPLATNPSAETQNLPYSKIEHLRECLLSVNARRDKQTKIVNRDLILDEIFYLCERGFYIADTDSLLYFPMLDEDSLNRDHHTWWHSAKAYTRY